MFYQEVFDALGKYKVRYLVIGGVAVNLYGYPRATFDLDLMIALEPENIERAWDAIRSLGYLTRVPITKAEFMDEQKRKELKEKKNMLVVSFFKGAKEYQVIDVMIENLLDFESCYQRRTSITVETTSVSVIHKDDLVRLKSSANRKQDSDDIEALKRLT